MPARRQRYGDWVRFAFFGRGDGGGDEIGFVLHNWGTRHEWDEIGFVSYILPGKAGETPAVRGIGFVSWK